MEVAIELVGTYPALQMAIRRARVVGAVCSTGFYQGEAHGAFLGRDWHHNRLNIVVPHGCDRHWRLPALGRGAPMRPSLRSFARASCAPRGQITPNAPLEGPAVLRLIEQEPEKVIKYAVQF